LPTTLLAAWALAGFYGSLGPTLVRQLAAGSVLLGGLALTVLAGSGALTRVLSPRTRRSDTDAPRHDALVAESP